MTTPIDPEEDTNPGNNVIPLHRSLIQDHNDRLSEHDKKLFNLADDFNHFTQVTFPKTDAKINRILDAQRETNKHIMSMVQPKKNMAVVWSTIGLAYLLISYLLFK